MQSSCLQKGIIKFRKVCLCFREYGFKLPRALIVELEVQMRILHAFIMLLEGYGAIFLPSFIYLCSKAISILPAPICEDIYSPDHKTSPYTRATQIRWAITSWGISDAYPNISFIKASGLGGRPRKSCKCRVTYLPGALKKDHTLSRSVSSLLPPGRRIFSRYNFPITGSSGAFLNTVANMSAANTREYMYLRV